MEVLDRIDQPTFTRRANEATEVSVTIPRGDIKLDRAELAGFLQVWQDGERKVSGRIGDRSVQQGHVTLTALTEEILLAANITPPQYGPALSNMDFADVARAVVDGWEWQRVRDWSKAIQTYRVDLTTMPGKVILARDSNNAHYANGFIVVRFRSSDFPGFKTWDRIRWLSDYDPPVKTTVQFRWGESPSEAQAMPWTPDTIHVGGEGEQDTVGVQGSMTDRLGVVPGTTAAAILDVRINLYTDDTESVEDEEEQSPRRGVTPVVYAVEAIARTHSGIQVGDIPSEAGVTVNSLAADEATSLAVLREASEQTGWNFRLENGRLDVAESFGSDRTNDLVLGHPADRVTRN